MCFKGIFKMTFELKILKANHGDSILISGDFDGQTRNILIDGGTSKVFSEGDLKKILREIKAKNQQIDLLILTHVDDDHIGGLLAAFKQDGFLSQLTKEVWFNSGKLIFKHFNQQHDETNLLDFKTLGNQTSISQGVKFESYIESLGIWNKQLIKAGDTLERFGATFKVLSPTDVELEKLLIKWEREEQSSLTSDGDNDYKFSMDELLENDKFIEDKSIHNGSSIAFIFEFLGKSILLLGDAYPTPVINNLRALGYSEQNPLKIDYVKVSHHGSKANTNEELLKLLDCNKFIISTNRSRYGLPDKLTLARIIKQFPNATLMFNYPDDFTDIFMKDKLENTSFSTVGCEKVIEL